MVYSVPECRQLDFFFLLSVNPKLPRPYTHLAHLPLRVVLAAASKVWNAKFERWSSSEAQKGELDHCETDSIVMQKLLDIIYTGKTQVENRAELLALAKEAECFNMQSVKAVMENELKEFVSKETCCELLMIARNSGLDGLDEACKEVLLREFEEVRSTVWRV